ncbi:multidrug resistance-associated protein 1, partial [Biomphalaria pfeifferi]
YKTDKILSFLTWKAFNLKHPQEGEKDSLLKPSDKRYHSTYSVNVGDRHKTFFTIIMTTFGWEFIYCNFGILLCALAYLCIPFLLGLLIDFIKDPDEPTWHGYIYLLAFVFIRIVNTVFRQSTEFLCVKLAIRVRSAIISALFQKALNLSNESQRKINEGEFLNLMFLDTNHVDMFLRNAYWLWMSVPMLLVSILLLSQIVGLSIISGFGIVCFIFCVKIILTQKQKQIFEEMMSCRDNRLSITSEALNVIKIIKLNGWEPIFINKILQARNKELKQLSKYVPIAVILTFIYTASTFWIFFSIFFTYLLLNEDHIDSKKTFLTINIVQLILMIIFNLPLSFIYTVQMATSIVRLNKFFELENLQTSNIQRNSSEEMAVQLENASFSWEITGQPCLRNLNFKVTPGSLVAVIGPVGAGKSSLLLALLGEMYKREGFINIQSSLAYVPQQSWIRNSTVRENITFGKQFDKELYEQTIKSCALKQDLETLPARDLTELGEKGVNLSGGQKQRISLARAVYSGANIFLLDDPISAVDGQVGQHIFKNVLSNAGLLRGKTRIMITHGLKWLPEVDYIVVMNDGNIVELGTFTNLVNKKGYFYDIIQKTSTKHADVKNNSNLESKDTFRETQYYKERLSINSVDIPDPYQMPSNAGDHKTMTVEEMEVGKVKWKVYLDILKCFGVFFGLAMAVFMIGFHLTYNISFLWLRSWNEDKNLLNHSMVSMNISLSDRLQMNENYIFVYIILGLIQSVCCIVYAILIHSRHVTTSRLLHTCLVNGVFKAPISFFDTTPLGRILNRFSQDINILDNTLFLQFEVYLEHAMFALGIITIICYTTPVLISIAIPAVLLLLFLQQFCIKTLCQLRRIASKNCSSVMAHGTEILSGLKVIRAYQQQQNFIQEAEIRTDNFQKPLILANAVIMWLQTRLDLISYVVIVCVILMSVVYRNDLEPGLPILSLTFVQMLTNEVTMVSRMASEIEINSVSVERVLDYSRVTPEASWILSGDNSALEEWPSQGSIEFVHYSSRYREGLDLVLKDINIYIKPGEKIGIIGRTGAGKSSFVLSLFRLIEAASGSILIDGIDISTIGLHKLRQGLTILPQDSVLLSGSLRMNLDLCNQRTDDELWQSLELVQLKQFCQSLPKKLDHDVGDGGCNLSVGQRQLVCLARTILNKTKILILDEATAAIDVETDQVIQRTISTAFHDCTVLTIAHRVNTLLDYNRIMVLHNGLVIEFDSPKTLLAQSNSHLSSMVNKSGQHL